MAKINNKTQEILENMIVCKFEDKRSALVEEIDAIKKRDSEITNENKDKCKDSIIRVVEKAQNDITKLLKTAGFELRNKYHNRECHFTRMFDSGELEHDWKDYIKPIAKKDERLTALERELEALIAKCKKAMDELVLRASLGCKYDDVMEFINNLEV